MVGATSGPVRGADDLLPRNHGLFDGTVRQREFLHTSFHLPELLRGYRVGIIECTDRWGTITRGRTADVGGAPTIHLRGIMP
jgi:hypothetical protein